jgi:hypothetical protein
MSNFKTARSRGVDVNNCVSPASACWLACILVADVRDEEQDQHVDLVLAGVHAATQFVTGLPGGTEFGSLEGLC